MEDNRWRSSDLLIALDTASRSGLDYIGGLFGVLRTAALEVDFSQNDPVLKWLDSEPDAGYRERIRTVVENAIARATPETPPAEPRCVRCTWSLGPASVERGDGLCLKCFEVDASHIAMATAEVQSASHDLTLEQHLRDIRDAAAPIERRLAAADWLWDHGFASRPMFKDGAALESVRADARRPKQSGRPDGFSQSAIDAAKATLLATGVKRGGK